MPHTKLTKQAKDLIFYHNFLLRGGQSFSQAARDVFALMDTAPPGNVKTLMAALTDSQVESGNFPLTDMLQFPNMDTSANASKNWMGNYSNALFVASPVHDPFDGITGNGTNSYIDTQYNPSVDSVVGVGQNDLQFGAWLVTNLDAGQATLFGGDGTGDIKLEQFTTPTFRARMNGAINNSSGTTLFEDGKMYSLRRTASANYDIITDKAATNIVRASSALVDTDISVLAFSGSIFMNGKVAMQYACKPTGFDHDNFFDNVKIFVDAMALLG